MMLDIGTLPFIQCNKAKPDQGLALDLCLWLEGAVVVAAGSSAVNEEGGACDELTFIAHEQLRHVRHLIRGAGAPCRALGKHVLVEITPGTIEFVDGQRRHNDTGCDVKWLFSVILSGLLS